MLHGQVRRSRSAEPISCVGICYCRFDCAAVSGDAFRKQCIRRVSRTSTCEVRQVPSASLQYTTKVKQCTDRDEIQLFHSISTISSRIHDIIIIIIIDIVI